MFSHPVIKGRHIYIVGTQRSGTTWVGNVLNRSRDVMYFYEPFQQNLGLFDSIYSEGVLIRRPSEKFVASLRHQHSELFSLNERSFPLNMFLRYVMGTGINALSRTRGSAWRRLAVINQWTGGKVREHLVAKNSILRPLIKETRLHLNLNLLKDAYPDCRTVLLLRHPYPVVESMIKWMARGHLMETKRHIECAFEVYRSQDEIYDAMPKAVQMMTGSFKEALVAQWFITNDFALAASPMLLSYESVCKNPTERFAELFAEVDLDFSSEVIAYVRETSEGPADSRGIVDTHKNSSKVYKAWSGDDREIMRAIESLADTSRAFSIVQKEYV